MGHLHFQEIIILRISGPYTNAPYTKLLVSLLGYLDQDDRSEHRGLQPPSHHALHAFSSCFAWRSCHETRALYRRTAINCFCYPQRLGPQLGLIEFLRENCKVQLAIIVFHLKMEMPEYTRF